MNSVGLTADFIAAPVCLGEPMTFISTSSPRNTILSIRWDLDADGQFDDAEGDTVIYLFPTPGIHDVGIQVTDTGGTIKALYRETIVRSASALFSIAHSCLGKPTPFINLSSYTQDSPLSLLWNFGDNITSDTTGNPLHRYAGTGPFTASLSITTIHGCTSSFSLTITLAPPPTITLRFSADTATWQGEPITATLDGETDSLRWSTGATTPSLMLTSEGAYFVTAWHHGCDSTLPFTLVNHFEPPPEIMNLLTPNNDGFNDQWIISGIDRCGTCSVTVFDQSGHQVYMNLNYDNTWEGTSDLGPLPAGNYYYIVSCSGGLSRKGVVAIVR